MKNDPKPIQKALLFFMKITLLNMLITSMTLTLGYAIDTSGQKSAINFQDCMICHELIRLLAINNH